MPASILVAFLNGCAAPQGPHEQVIDAGAYAAVFDAAIEASRRAGMPAVRRDRRNGIIETQPRIAGSVLEPWRGEGQTLGRAMANTINFQRRHVRFEFTPVSESMPDAFEIDTQGALEGPDYSGVSASPVDLTTYEGDILMRCIVVIERNHRPGIRPNTWTVRRLTEQAKLGGPEADLPQNFWTPVSRDEQYERRMMAQVNDIAHIEPDDVVRQAP